MLRFGIRSPRRIFYAGESVRFFLESDQPFPAGQAFLRTNLGMAQVRRREIINEVEQGKRSAGRDWRDLTLRPTRENCFELELLLTETGVFELKGFFAPAAEQHEYLWPDGENLKLKVESAENVGANLIYTAFVRQFGPNCQLAHSAAENPAAAALDKLNYTVIPPSGTFRDLKKQLDFIFGTLGCRILQLLPIHPVPTVYGRMGRFGSPFASLDYFAVDPALAEFDECATPLEQFGELVDAVHARKGRIFLDIPVNHTGWASTLQTHHPEWFVRENSTGRIESPGAWGIVWADLCKLDYSRSEVQRFMADVFLYWCRKGVDGFRCDAGYMLPVEAWKYIEAKVRSEYPDTVFMLEGLGGPTDKQEVLLRDCGLDWAYSELFQNYSRSEVENYAGYAGYVSGSCGTLINFAETHDNNRLAATSKVYAKMRCALMCVLSEGGTFGFTNGVEWFAAEKVDVHGSSALNWGASDNMVDYLQHLHAVMRRHGAFYGGAEKRIQNHAGSQALAIARSRDGESVLALINLDCQNSSTVVFDWNMWQGKTLAGTDLLTGRTCTLVSGGNRLSYQLAPGECCIICDDAEYYQQIAGELQSPFRTPEVIRQQKLDLALGKAMLAAGIPLDEKIHTLLQKIRSNPGELFRTRPVVDFYDDIDTNRLVMVPPGWCLAIYSKFAFRAELKLGEKTLRFERSVHISDNCYFALFAPLGDAAIPAEDPILELTVFENDQVVRRRSHLRYLPPEGSSEPVQLHFDNAALKSGPPRHALAVNDLGGYAQIPGCWGHWVSKYDALLAANLNSDYPVDRRIMLVNCKVWLVLNGFSQEVSFAVQEHFRIGTRNLARWEFDVPVGQGKAVKLDITGRFAFNANAVKLEFRRRPAGGNPRLLADDIKVRIIVRCGIDDRDNHAVTKAYAGAEKYFPRAITPLNDGFIFAPTSGKLTVRMSECRFFSEAQWSYMNELPLENYYGLDHQSDLYSPGYLAGELPGNHTFTLEGICNVPAVEPEYPQVDRFPASCDLMSCAFESLKTFVVRRNEFNTVIAGYPWFLDWGRDTFIALRGLIAAGMLDEARSILLQFAAFEKSGTIPNMIRGSNDSNRETSDAPLWLAVALNDYIRAAGDSSILKMRCGSRTVLEIIESIAYHYRNGTTNGIFADKESNLIYSPPHCTWMDTNYPAGSPRAGYPVEIQALWYALQKMLADYLPEYKSGAEKTSESIQKYFYLAQYRRLSDCLHAAPDTPAAAAVPDNALRPNMLFAVTLGAISDITIAREIVESASALIIPGAIRSLGNFEVTPPLPVKLHGQLLNDPRHPYCGHYCGPEDTSRKVAYHNGTAWCWPFPSYVEAFYMVNGDAVLTAARKLLESASSYFNDGCPGQLPEIADGDYPHNWGGCAAQAWSVSEFYRVGKLLGLQVQ